MVFGEGEQFLHLGCRQVQDIEGLVWGHPQDHAFHREDGVIQAAEEFWLWAAPSGMVMEGVQAFLLLGDYLAWHGGIRAAAIAFFP